MWLRDLTQLPSSLQEITSLLREQNLLLRELILASTGRPAETFKTRPPDQPPRRKLTAGDVRAHTRESLAAVQALQRARAAAPWRSEDLSPPATTPASPTPQASASPTADASASPPAPSAAP